MSLKSTLKKVWHFLWHEDSLASWIVSALLAFILVKFIIYPGLGLLLGTGYPVVAVVSGSMEHRSVPYGAGYTICGTLTDQKQNYNFDEYWNTCGQWYETNSITKDQFTDFKLHNGFNTGSIIVLRGATQENIAIGDIIVFQDEAVCRIYGKCDPIIHRVVKISEKDGERVYQTKGDHNGDSDKLEKDIRQNQILGKAVMKIPYLGYVKLLAVKLLNTITGHS